MDIGNDNKAAVARTLPETSAGGDGSAAIRTKQSSNCKQNNKNHSNTTKNNDAGQTRGGNSGVQQQSKNDDKQHHHHHHHHQHVPGAAAGSGGGGGTAGSVNASRVGDFHNTDDITSNKSLKYLQTIEQKTLLNCEGIKSNKNNNSNNNNSNSNKSYYSNNSNKKKNNNTNQQQMVQRVRQHQQLQQQQQQQNQNTNNHNHKGYNLGKHYQLKQVPPPPSQLYTANVLVSISTSSSSTSSSPSASSSSSASSTASSTGSTKKLLNGFRSLDNSSSTNGGGISNSTSSNYTNSIDTITTTANGNGALTLTAAAAKTITATTSGAGAVAARGTPLSAAAVASISTTTTTALLTAGGTMAVGNFNKQNHYPRSKQAVLMATTSTSSSTGLVESVMTMVAAAAAPTASTSALQIDQGDSTNTYMMMRPGTIDLQPTPATDSAAEVVLAIQAAAVAVASSVSSSLSSASSLSCNSSGSSIFSLLAAAAAASGSDVSSAVAALPVSNKAAALQPPTVTPTPTNAGNIVIVHAYNGYGGNGNGNGNGNGGYHSKFHFTIPSDILDDLASRFIINVPDIEQQNLIRICFQIELAHWFYLDFYCPNEEEEKEKLHPCGMKQFAMQIFQHIPFLRAHLSSVDKILEDWKNYKLAVPTYGAILISEDLNFCLLVQSYFAKSSWGFPKGKINEHEDPVHCATREVYEETGFDITDLIVPNEFIEAVINYQQTRLYIVVDVPLETTFAPRTRNEIKCCDWFPIDSLPANKSDNNSKLKLGINANSFFMIMPFVKRLKRWVNDRRSDNDAAANALSSSSASSGTTSNININTHRRKYSGCCGGKNVFPPSFANVEPPNGTMSPPPPVVSGAPIGVASVVLMPQMVGPILQPTMAVAPYNRQYNHINAPRYSAKKNKNKNGYNNGCDKQQQANGEHSSEHIPFTASGGDECGADRTNDNQSRRQRHKSMGDLDGVRPQQCNEKGTNIRHNQYKANNLNDKGEIGSQSSQRQLFHSQSQNGSSKHDDVDKMKPPSTTADSNKKPSGAKQPKANIAANNNSEDDDNDNDNDDDVNSSTSNGSASSGSGAIAGGDSQQKFANKLQKQISMVITNSNAKIGGILHVSPSMMLKIRTPSPGTGQDSTLQQYGKRGAAITEKCGPQTPQTPLDSATLFALPASTSSPPPSVIQELQRYTNEKTLRLLKPRSATTPPTPSADVAENPSTPVQQQQQHLMSPPVVELLAKFEHINQQVQQHQLTTPTRVRNLQQIEEEQIQLQLQQMQLQKQQQMLKQERQYGSPLLHLQEIEAEQRQRQQQQQELLQQELLQQELLQQQQFKTIASCLNGKQSPLSDCSSKPASSPQLAVGVTIAQQQPHAPMLPRLLNLQQVEREQLAVQHQQMQMHQQQLQQEQELSKPHTPSFILKEIDLQELQKRHQQKLRQHRAHSPPRTELMKLLERDAEQLVAAEREQQMRLLQAQLHMEQLNLLRRSETEFLDNAAYQLQADPTLQSQKLYMGANAHDAYTKIAGDTAVGDDAKVIADAVRVAASDPNNAHEDGDCRPAFRPPRLPEFNPILPPTWTNFAFSTNFLSNIFC